MGYRTDAISLSTARSGQWFDYAWMALILLTSLALLLDSPWFLPIACAFLLGAVLFKRIWALYPGALLLFLLFSYPIVAPKVFLQVPGLSLSLPLLLAALFCLPFPFARRQFACWLRAGEGNTITRLWTVTIGLVFALIIIFCLLWAEGLGALAIFQAELQGVPKWFLFLGVPFFALLNAAVEEGVYRGVLQESLEQRFPGKTRLVLFVQASAFAATRCMMGFPGGLVGYGVALGYGMFLGRLRMQTGGMRAPFLAHFLCDLVIGFTLVLVAGS